MTELFSRICKVLFTFEDGSTLLCVTTLNPDILSEKGLADVNGIIDLSSGKIMPEDLFDYPFEILADNDDPRSDLDKFFDIGGKVHWTPATLY